MKLKIEFDCDNDTFADGPINEVARTLHGLAEHIEKLADVGSTAIDLVGAEGRILDYSGNIVGKWSLGEPS